MRNLDPTFQKLCHEAAIACGDDIAAVERYVREKIAGLPADERARIRRDIDRVLSFVPPQVRPRHDQ